MFPLPIESKFILVPPFQIRALCFHPYLSSLDSVLPLRSFIEAQYSLTAWEFVYMKGPPHTFSSLRALASPGVGPIPAAPDAEGTLLWVVPDPSVSQGTPWG